MPSSSSHLPSKYFLVLVVSLFLGVCFDVLFFGERWPGLAFPVYVFLILAGVLAMSGAFKKSVPSSALLLMAPALFFSGMLFVRASMPLGLLNILTTIVLLALIVRSCGLPLRRFTFLDYLFSVIILPLKSVIIGIRSLLRFPSFFGFGKRASTTHLIRGTVITLPILFVFLLLLSSADPVFRHYILAITNLSISPDFPARTFLVLMASIGFLGAYSIIFFEGQKTLPPLPFRKEFGIIEASMLLGALDLLFFVFLLVQVNVLFAGESAIRDLGFTYAEYARQGFFQLLTVSALSFLLTLTIERWIARREGGHFRRFTALSTVLIVQALILLVSAYLRLSLYEQAYGFTILRLFSHAFMIWLAVLLLWLLVSVYRKIREGDFLLGVLSTGLVTLGVLNVLNPDAYIVRMNLQLAERTGKFDTAYLWELSDDAVPEIAQVLRFPDPVVQNDVRGLLGNRYWHTMAVPNQPWQSLTLSRIRAKAFLESLPTADVPKQL